MPCTHVALLRAINLGPVNRISMKDLTAMFAKAGCGDVSTYIVSGNVIFTATPALADGLPALISAQIEKRFGYSVPVILRTAGELAKVIANNPFLKAGASENEMHVSFLADAPEPGRFQDFDPARYAPDEFIVKGREIYLRLPNGVGRSKLTSQYFNSKRAVVGTLRNWRTVNKLLELTKA